VRHWETSLYSQTLSQTQTYITHMGTKTLMVQSMYASAELPNAFCRHFYPNNLQCIQDMCFISSCLPWESNPSLKLLFADTLIQIIYIAFKIGIWSVYAFLGNQTHNHKTVNGPLFELQELPDLGETVPKTCTVPHCMHNPYHSIYYAQIHLNQQIQRTDVCCYTTVCLKGNSTEKLCGHRQ